jgi:hypothetical protein
MRTARVSLFTLPSRAACQRRHPGCGGRQQGHRNIEQELAVFELQSLFVVVWLTLIGAPPAALLIVSMLRWKAPAKIKPLATAAGLLICVAALFFFAHLRFTQPSTTVVCVALAYWAYCILASIWLKRQLTLVHVLVSVVLIAPVITLYITLCALRTTAMPLSVMVLGDMMQRPVRVQYMDNGLVCKITPWGNMGVSGYNTTLFRTSPLVPFLERKVAEIDVTEQHDSHEPATCTLVLRKYSGS